MVSQLEEVAAQRSSEPVKMVFQGIKILQSHSSWLITLFIVESVAIPFLGY
jgi:hypothetical protein